LFTKPIANFARTPAPVFHVRFYPFVSTQQHDSAARGRDSIFALSDLLEGSPDGILHSILHILLAKLYRHRSSARTAPVSALHCQSRRDRESAAGAADAGTQAHRSARGTPLPPGRNLRRISTALFHGLLGRPHYYWSQNRARAAWPLRPGAQRHRHQPRFSTIRGCRDMAVEYIVYHEMLHLKHPVKLRGAGDACTRENFWTKRNSFLSWRLLRSSWDHVKAGETPPLTAGPAKCHSMHAFPCDANHSHR